MSGMYRVPFSYTGNGNVDLLEITAGAAQPVAIHGIFISQTSDVGDAAEEIIQLLLKSGQTSSGTGGSASTPVANDPASAPTPGFSAEQANTTLASGGTIVTHPIEAWNVRQGYDRLFSELEVILLRGGRRATLELPGASDSLTISGYLLVQEIA